MDQIIIELRTNHLPLIHQMIKFNSAINKTYEQTLDSDLYLETINDAILYVFRDFNAFQRIHKPIENLNKLLVKLIRLSPKEEEEYLNGTLKPDALPRDGLHFYITCHTHPLEELFPILKKFYCSIHSDITVDLDNDAKRIIINFHTNEAAYRNFSLMLHGAIESKKMINHEKK